MSEAEMHAHLHALFFDHELTNSFSFLYSLVSHWLAFHYRRMKSTCLSVTLEASRILAQISLPALPPVSLRL